MKETANNDLILLLAVSFIMTIVLKFAFDTVLQNILFYTNLTYIYNFVFLPQVFSTKLFTFQDISLCEKHFYYCSVCPSAF